MDCNPRKKRMTVNLPLFKFKDCSTLSNEKIGTIPAHYSWERFRTFWVNWLESRSVFLFRALSRRWDERRMTKPTKWLHPPSLIRVFAVCMKKAWVLSYLLSAQRRLWSDRADAQADLSLRSAQSWFCHEAAHVIFCRLRPACFHVAVPPLSDKRGM